MEKNALNSYHVKYQTRNLDYHPQTSCLRRSNSLCRNELKTKIKIKENKCYQATSQEGMMLSTTTHILVI